MFKSKAIIILFSLFCFGFSLVAASSVLAADMKIAVMNVQKVLTSSVAGKAAKVKFDAKMKELQDKFKVDFRLKIIFISSRIDMENYTSNLRMPPVIWYWNQKM